NLPTRLPSRRTVIALHKEIDEQPDLRREMAAVRIEGVDFIGLRLERLEKTDHAPRSDCLAGHEARDAGKAETGFGRLEAGFGVGIAYPPLHAGQLRLSFSVAERPALRLAEIGIDDADMPRQIGGRFGPAMPLDIVRWRDHDDAHC